LLPAPPGIVVGAVPVGPVVGIGPLGAVVAELGVEVVVVA
jgi:hypothetical protein